MVQNSKFTIQLLDKIGAPLASAIEAVSLEGDDTDVQAAKIMAQLLGQAVQISIILNSSLNVVEDGAQADSTRLALASLAAPLLADFYKNNERVPEDQDIKRLTKSLEAVIAFADNFSAAEDEKSRLVTLDHDAPLFDKTQSTLVLMQAMTPVMTAVSEFSFGQSEAKLSQEITNRIEATAKDVAKKIKLEDKLSELMIVKALANLYADCHRTQTHKLANDTSDDRGELSLTPVWDAFGQRVAMIEAVMGVESSVVADTSTTSSVVAPAAVSEAEPPKAPLPAAEPASAPSSPMGFFKKPDAQNTAASSTAMTPETPPQPQQPADASANVEAQPAVSTPPVEAPATPAEPVAPPTQQEAPASSDKPVNPMGFFKPGAKKAAGDNGEQA